MRNVSVCSLGNHAVRNILPAIDRSEDVTLVGLWTRNKKNRAKHSNIYGVKDYSSLQDLLSDKETDTVLVCSPTGLHHHYGTKVLESGKNLWCEKSLVCSLSELSELEDIASKKSLEINEMFMFLHHQQFETIANIIKSGKIGKLISVSSSFGFPHLDMGDVRYDRNMGGGALFDAGCYPVAICHELLGPNPIDIWSKISTERGYEVDTSGTCIFHYNSGEVAIMEWGFGQHYRNEVDIIGSEGRLRASRVFSKPKELETVIEISDNSGTHELVVPGMDHFQKMIENFAHNIRDYEWNKNQATLIQRIFESSS